MPDPVITVLDTTVSDTGETQTAKANFLNKDKPIRFSAAIGSGDTVVIEGKAETADDFETLHTFTDDTPADVYVSAIWRARRTVDGGSADSTIKVQNSFNQRITAHTA